MAAFTSIINFLLHFDYRELGYLLQWQDEFKKLKIWFEKRG
ncbi:hypothetical protein M595_3880 [Lyngbya aestuarii BL J]|uniref:Uncharacterized protein n=1 Tax=Lyngbya aestuarii BL J TaxID=1348334 RepID=U7QGE5_9CYAN|nr:hypothetical protein M595_3880 [Lyngbya aestuarii BL J]